MLVFRSRKYISSNLLVINFSISALLISAVDKCLTPSCMFCGNEKILLYLVFLWLSLFTMSRLVNLVSVQCRILHCKTGDCFINSHSSFKCASV